MTKSTKVRLLAHGDRLPAACPTEEGIIRVGCVDGPELADGDDSEKGANEGRDDGRQGVEESLIAKLGTGWLAEMLSSAADGCITHELHLAGNESDQVRDNHCGATCKEDRSGGRIELFGP